MTNMSEFHIVFSSSGVIRYRRARVPKRKEIGKTEIVEPSVSFETEAAIPI